jgi:putative oxidoreductase
MSLLKRLQYTEAPDWTMLVRLLVGLIVFFPEGIQKLLFPDILGAGRFTRIGIPFPEIMGPFVDSVEIVCGLLIILGWYARLAAIPLIVIPLIVIMIVAITSTKIPILLGNDFGIFHLPPDIKRVSFWTAQHEARADLVMLLGLLFLLIVGAWRWSLDAWLIRLEDTDRSWGLCKVDPHER